jgi:hypothetical protein
LARLIDSPSEGGDDGWTAGADWDQAIAVLHTKVVMKIAAKKATCAFRRRRKHLLLEPR